VRALDSRLVRRARAVRVLLGLDVALGVATAILLIVQASLLARIVTQGFEGASPAAVGSAAALLVLAFAARGLAAWGFEVAGARAASSVLSGLRLELV
jgi:ABC-type transport system involved in cytochrome bd biosynthesis fused ATPase/permease subunit